MTGESRISSEVLDPDDWLLTAFIRDFSKKYSKDLESETCSYEASVESSGPKEPRHNADFDEKAPSPSGNKRKAHPDIMTTATKQPKRADHKSPQNSLLHLGDTGELKVPSMEELDAIYSERSARRTMPPPPTYSAPSFRQSATYSAIPIDLPSSLSSSTTSQVVLPIKRSIQAPYIYSDCSPLAIGEDGKKAESGPFIRLHPDGCSCMSNTQFTRDYGYQLVTPVSVSDHLMFGTWFVRVSLHKTTKNKSNFQLSCWPASKHITESEQPWYERDRNTITASFQITMARHNGSFTSDLNFLRDKLRRNKSVMRAAEATGNRYQAQGHIAPFSFERFHRMLTVAFFNADGAKGHRLEP